MPFIYTVVLSTKHHETIATCVSRLFVAPWTVGSQPPLSVKLSSKNTRMGSYSLLQGIFPTQRLNLGLLPCRQILYHLSHREVLYCLMSMLTLSYVQSFATYGLKPSRAQVALSMEFSRQEYCTGWPFPSPGCLPNPGIEPRSSTLQTCCLPSEPSVKFGEQ